MNKSKLFIALLIGILVAVSTACQEKPKESKPESISEGEESGTRLAVSDTYDSVRNGVRLILNYDNPASSFIGTVENVTEKTIKSVRVEVHLSNGIELGPTKPIDLTSGQKEEVKLSAEEQTFNWWKAHPEAGEGEHSVEDEHEGKSEHESDSKGEHSSERESREHN